MAPEVTSGLGETIQVAGIYMAHLACYTIPTRERVFGGVLP